MVTIRIQFSTLLLRWAENQRNSFQLTEHVEPEKRTEQKAKDFPYHETAYYSVNKSKIFICLRDIANEIYDCEISVQINMTSAHLYMQTAITSSMVKFLFVCPVTTEV